MLQMTNISGLRIVINSHVQKEKYMVFIDQWFPFRSQGRSAPGASHRQVKYVQPDYHETVILF